MESNKFENKLSLQVEVNFYINSQIRNTLHDKTASGINYFTTFFLNSSECRILMFNCMPVMKISAGDFNEGVLHDLISQSLLRTVFQI